jgi:hypothetical protein
MSLSVSELILSGKQIDKEVDDLLSQVASRRAARAAIDRQIEAIALRGAEEDDAPDFSMFPDTARRLLVNLWDAPDSRMLSQEDIREDVMFDRDANDDAVRQTVSKVRKELRRKNSIYDIKNIKNKGYQLVLRQDSSNVTNVTKPTKKPRKMGKKRR